ncbi:MAG: hypothetical protein Q8Q57_03715 [Methylotenera sp.]|nr:hypothetical protein [Methylotenera sp.]
MKIKKANEEYLEKAKSLSEEEVERLQSRMRAKLTRREEDKKLTPIEALAIQLELDDEQLAEWREKRIEINKKTKNSVGSHPSASIVVGII